MSLLCGDFCLRLGSLNDTQLTRIRACRPEVVVLRGGFLLRQLRVNDYDGKL